MSDISDSQLHKLYRLLNNRNYYSLSTDYVKRKTGILRVVMRYQLSNPNSVLYHRFLALMSDTLNVFVYNSVEYIGLETRRLDYERDKDNGTNWVEAAIARGEYGT
jgi:hypothetical protein